MKTKRVARLTEASAEVERDSFTSTVTITLSDWKGATERIVLVEMDWTDAAGLARDIRAQIKEKAQRLLASLEEA